MADTVRRADPFGLSESILDGRFKVLQPVAEGGFGVVYRAAQLALERTVALKVLKMDFPHDRRTVRAVSRALRRRGPDNRAHPASEHCRRLRFRGFADALRRFGAVDGPRMAERRDARRVAGCPSGPGGRSPAEALALTRPILRAMAYAHREGIAHRDIKPGNLMLCAPEPCPQRTKAAWTLHPGLRDRKGDEPR